MHHIISKRIHEALEKLPQLKGKFSKRDPRFTSQALDKAAHNGYFGWHEQLDDEIASWLNNNRNVTEEKFMEYLHKRYSQPDLLKKFPEGF